MENDSHPMARLTHRVRNDSSQKRKNDGPMAPLHIHFTFAKKNKKLAKLSKNKNNTVQQLARWTAKRQMHLTTTLSRQ